MNNHSPVATAITKEIGISPPSQAPLSGACVLPDAQIPKQLADDRPFEHSVAMSGVQSMSISSLAPSSETEETTNTTCKNTVKPERPIKMRNRLSAADRKARLESIDADYRAGHPLLAIMLRNHLSKPQLTEMLACLLLTGTLKATVPTYEVLPASQAIKNIPGLGLSAGGYVHVEKTEKGVLLTPYPQGGGGYE